MQVACAGVVTCLLCHNADGVLLRSGDTLWRFECPDCGAYEFDNTFGNLVGRARAGRADDVLAYCGPLTRQCHEALLHGRTLRVVGEYLPPHATVI